MSSQFAALAVISFVLSAACGDADGQANDPTPAPVTSGVADTTAHGFDGTLDCENDLRFEQHWEREAGTQGPSTPEQAVREALGAFSDDADRARILMVDDNQGSVVVDDREVVTALASEHELGWFVMQATGCSDGREDT